MRSFYSFFQRPRLNRSAVACETRAIVGHVELQVVVLHLERDIDALGPAMPDGVGNGLAKEMLQIELQPGSGSGRPGR